MGAGSASSSAVLWRDFLAGGLAGSVRALVLLGHRRLMACASPRDLKAHICPPSFLSRGARWGCCCHGDGREEGSPCTERAGWAHHRLLPGGRRRWGPLTWQVCLGASDAAPCRSVTELGGTQVSSSRLSGCLCWGVRGGPGVGVAPTSIRWFFTRITLSRLRTCLVSSSLGAGVASYQSLDGGRGVTEPGFTQPPREDVLQVVRRLCPFP